MVRVDFERVLARERMQASLTTLRPVRPVVNSARSADTMKTSGVPPMELFKQMVSHSFHPTNPMFPLPAVHGDGDAGTPHGWGGPRPAWGADDGRSSDRRKRRRSRSPRRR